MDSFGETLTEIHRELTLFRMEVNGQELFVRRPRLPVIHQTIRIEDASDDLVIVGNGYRDWF